MKANIRKNILTCYLTGIIAFILVPFYMFGVNPIDFVFLDYIVFIKTGILYSFVFGTILAAFYFLFLPIKKYKISEVFVFIVFLWVIVAGLLIPVSSNSGMIDPENSGLNLLHVFLLIIILFSVTYLRFHLGSRYIDIFVGVLLFSTMTTSGFKIYNSEFFDHKKSFSDSRVLSSKKNILVISFDSIPGHAVSTILKENSKYNSILKDFIFFENSVSQSPATLASLMGDLFGVQDYKSVGDSIFSVRNKLKENGFHKYLLSSHFPDTYQILYGGYGIKSMDTTNNLLKVQNKQDTFLIFNYSVARIWSRYGTKFFIRVLRLFDFKKRMLSSHELKTNFLSKLENHTGPNWDRKNLLTMNVFNSFVSGLSVADKEVSVRYLHFVFSHAPVDFNSECEYKSNDLEWHNANKNEMGVIKSTKCVLKVFSQLLMKLKELGIYDNSLIVLKSDHGEPVSLYSTKPNNFRINEHKLWGYDRYRPMLLLKNFNSLKNKITIRKDLVVLPDIARTLCKAADITVDCSKLNGADLLDENIDSNIPYYIYVVRNAASSYRFIDNVSVKVNSRNQSLIDIMNNSPLITLSERN